MADNIGISALKQAGLNTGQGILGAGLQSLFNLGMMKRENKYQRQLLALQDKYQRKMIEDQPGLIKAGLMRAGYSAADPAGTGTTAPTVSVPGSAATSQVSAPSLPGVDVGYLSQTMAQADNLNSLTELNRIEAANKQAQMEANISYLNAQTKNILDQLPKRMQLLGQELVNMKANKQLTDEQIKRVSEETQKIIEETAAIRIDNKYLDKKSYYNAEAAAEEFKKLAFQNDVEGMKAYLAQFGIIAGYNLPQSIAAFALSGSEDVLPALSSTVQGVFKDLPDVAGSMIQTFFDTIISLPVEVLKKLANGFKSIPRKIYESFKK